MEKHGQNRIPASAGMTAATAKDLLNHGPHTVPQALQAARVGPNHTPAVAQVVWLRKQN